MIRKRLTLLISLAFLVDSFPLAYAIKWPKEDNAAAKIKSFENDRFFLNKNVSAAANALPRTNNWMPEKVRFPNDTVLEAEFARIFTVNVDLFANGLEYDPIKHKEYHHYITKFDLLDEFKQQNVECLHDGKSLCTSDLKTIQRTVMFPRLRKIAVSKCRYCSGLEYHFECECKPVYVLQPALRPGKLEADGFHERLPCLELVPITYSNYTIDNFSIPSQRYHNDLKIEL